MKDFGPLIFLSVVVAFLIWYFFYRGKSQNNDLVQVAYPHGGSTIPAATDVNGIAVQLHDSMKGGFFKKLHWYSFLPPALIAAQLSSTGAEDNAWQKLYNQNDETVIAVYNVFNKKYGSEGNGTLTKWIDGTNAELSGRALKNKLLAKLRSLKLY